ncbi:polysaccharide export outer membrane protein [Mucilaginibacter yixingensis]|uniref:Polysaccharide export outer membrane protein n=1 Tax=Mucilaginibacter yixingensis TaxID=1295612 RepID=A0A2T5JC43_9SPHI|nr:polysaccharide biosynthesis/export family protein [Mucilaginibacter yixingensis]PTQ99326.1 polysaccharide export outer membrane protein [Mucilaginibacter yixingensis]
MKLSLKIIILLFITLWGTSCTSYKDVAYFQDMKVDSVYNEKINNYTQITIQPGDLLAIQANSLNKDQDNLINYNLERTNGTSSVSINRPGENVIYGYLVDQNGNIKLPFIGVVKVAGLTTQALGDQLEISLSNYLSKPIITARIQNLKVSVLGDVKTPGVYNFNDERMTVAEALGMAGDLNTTGIRQNLLLIREINGERKYIKLDLRSKSVINSPYFYLKNNDVLYVQPNKDKVFGSDSTLQKVALLISALSIAAIFITRVN